MVIAPRGKGTRPATWQCLGVFRVGIELLDRFDSIVMFPEWSANADIMGNLVPPVRGQYFDNREE